MPLPLSLEGAERRGNVVRLVFRMTTPVGTRGGVVDSVNSLALWTLKHTLGLEAARWGRADGSAGSVYIAFPQLLFSPQSRRGGFWHGLESHPFTVVPSSTQSGTGSSTSSDLFYVFIRVSRSRTCLRKDTWAQSVAALVEGDGGSGSTCAVPSPTACLCFQAYGSVSKRVLECDCVLIIAGGTGFTAAAAALAALVRERSNDRAIANQTVHVLFACRESYLMNWARPLLDLHLDSEMGGGRIVNELRLHITRDSGKSAERCSDAHVHAAGVQIGSSLSLSSSSRSSPSSSSFMPGNGEAKPPSTTSSQDECKFGRPSVKAFVDSVVQRELQEGCHAQPQDQGGEKPSCRGSLGLLVCGPIGMTRDVCRAAKNARSQGFVVVLDREAFEV